MANRIKLTKRTIETLPLPPAEKRTGAVWWDTELRGFGLRIYPSGQRVFLVKYRTTEGTQRKPKIGAFGELTVEQARRLAQDMLAKVRAGDDPSASRTDARRAPTMADLADRFLEEHARPHKKPSSVYMDEKNLANHVLPRFGSRKVKGITYADVAELHHAMRETPGAANRVVALLSKMFNLAERWGLRPLNSNPCRHLEKYQERKLHRDLTELELARLAKALREWPTKTRKPAQDAEGKRRKHSRTDETLLLTPQEQAVREQACNVVRLLLFTGLRRGEALGLRWAEVDLDRGLLRLADSKTGAKVVVLNSAAREVIERQTKVDLNPFVFPSKRKGRGYGKPIADLKNPWAEIRALAGLGDVRVHDLRHNFASFGAAGGAGLPVIGKLLGHKSAQTTMRYADVADDPARRATEAIGQALTKAMKGAGGER